MKTGFYTVKCTPPQGFPSRFRAGKPWSKGTHYAELTESEVAALRADECFVVLAVSPEDYERNKEHIPLTPEQQLAALRAENENLKIAMVELGARFVALEDRLSSTLAHAEGKPSAGVPLPPLDAEKAPAPPAQEPSAKSAKPPKSAKTPEPAAEVFLDDKSHN